MLVAWAEKTSAFCDTGGICAKRDGEIGGLAGENEQACKSARNGDNKLWIDEWRLVN